MNIILFDDPKIKISLQPFTYTRPVALIRVGILTIAGKWEAYLKLKMSFFTEEYLSSKYPSVQNSLNILINGALLPDKNILSEIESLKEDQCLIKDGMLLAVKINFLPHYGEIENFYAGLEKIEYANAIQVIRNNWEIFSLNGNQIREDFALFDKRHSFTIDDRHTIVYNKENIFIEEGVKIRAAILNAESGPIFLGKNAEIQEGSIIKGPFALCEGAVVNMGAKMRGDTTVGPYSKVGGEINNSVIFGYSNKAHDGFLGNSVIGEWCNLGADTNTSNMKNNYSNVRVWSYLFNDYIDSDRQFCGLMMGDHSKAGINTMFNTGTVVGVNANIFGGGFPPKFIPSYAWGGSEGFQRFEFDKAMQVASKAMERRNIMLENEDFDILKYVYNIS